jgi:hypothetical protein
MEPDGHAEVLHPEMVEQKALQADVVPDRDRGGEVRGVPAAVRLAGVGGHGRGRAVRRAEVVAAHDEIAGAVEGEIRAVAEDLAPPLRDVAVAREAVAHDHGVIASLRREDGGGGG